MIDHGMTDGFCLLVAGCLNIFFYFLAVGSIRLCRSALNLLDWICVPAMDMALLVYIRVSPPILSYQAQRTLSNLEYRTDLKEGQRNQYEVF